MAINAKDEDGFTPLHRAARNNAKDVVVLLLNSKFQVDINAKGE